MLEPGSLVGGRYRVGRVLGRGGMGVVVEGVHEQLGTRVAIKVMREERAKKPDNVQRFLREARAAAQLRSEHVCRVHDFGTLDDGAPYMVMELLDGRDLATLLKQGGPLDVGIVARYMLQVCAAMAEAHALGLVHRDLKPGNLFLVERPDGSPAIKVLDFGIAKASSYDRDLTDTDNVLGSPVYMSPEQLKSSKNLDARSDIWSIGIVMYELAAGHAPFGGDGPTEVALAITTERLPAMPARVPRRYSEVVRRCLHKQASRRYPDVAALAEALEPLASTDPSGAKAVARVLASASVTGHATAPAIPSMLQAKETTLGRASGERAPTMRARPRWLVAAALAGALAVGSVATALILGARSSGDAPARPPGPAVAPAARVDARVPASAPVDAPSPARAATVDAAIVDSAPAPVAAPPARHRVPRPKRAPEPDLGRSRY
ncbi:MAG: serine/threonine-protein kinase [Acidobacteriota bacterium]